MTVKTAFVHLHQEDMDEKTKIKVKKLVDQGLLDNAVAFLVIKVGCSPDLARKYVYSII